MNRDDPHDEPRIPHEIPLYVSLARTLTDEIGAGQPAIGALLPTEEALARAHGVSRQTVREALRLLEEQGLVTRRRGIGTRVVSDAPRHRYSIEIESVNDIVELVKQVRLKVTGIRPVVATGRLAERLACREGTRWLEVRGLRVRSDEPDTAVAMVDCYLRDGYPGIEEALHELGENAIHRLLEQRYGEQIDEIRQRIRAVAIAPADAVRLGVPARSPGLRIDRHFVGRGGRVVFSGYLIYPGETFSYTGTFRRDRGN